MRINCRGIGLLLAIALATASSAPVLKVTTRLIQVNVLVHDHHGNPVADLTKDDFEISDQGKEQRIAVFRVDSTVAALQMPAKVMPRNEFSNRLDRQSQVPTAVTVVLIDFLNTPWKDQAYARRQILKFLRQIRTEDRIALYSTVLSKPKPNS